MTKFIEKVAIAVIIVCAVAAVLGTLATPLVLAYFYSWYWMLLYVLYVAAFLVAVSRGGGKEAGRE